VYWANGQTWHSGTPLPSQVSGLGLWLQTWVVSLWRGPEISLLADPRPGPGGSSRETSLGPKNLLALSNPQSRCLFLPLFWSVHPAQDPMGTIPPCSFTVTSPFLPSHCRLFFFFFNLQCYSAHILTSTTRLAKQLWQQELSAVFVASQSRRTT
jgi:hypothetical protein